MSLFTVNQVVEEKGPQWAKEDFNSLSVTVLYMYIFTHILYVLNRANYQFIQQIMSLNMSPNPPLAARKLVALQVEVDI